VDHATASFVYAEIIAKWTASPIRITKVFDKLAGSRLAKTFLVLGPPGDIF